MSNVGRELTYVKCNAPIFAPSPGGKSVNLTHTLTPRNVQPDRCLKLTFEGTGVLAITTTGIEVFIPLSNISNVVFAKA